MGHVFELGTCMHDIEIDFQGENAWNTSWHNLLQSQISYAEMIKMIRIIQILWQSMENLGTSNMAKRMFSKRTRHYV
jgi:hypothetical protein